MSKLPMHDEPPPIELPAPSADVVALLEQARAATSDAARLEALRAAVRTAPTFLDGWAALADHALAQGDPVAAYAYARVGYHRGLDAIRKAGWRGAGAVPWRHEPNRGFLRSLDALMRAAGAIGETEEEERCRAFQLDLDPDDALGVGR